MIISPDGVLLQVRNSDLEPGVFFRVPAEVRVISGTAFMGCTEVTSVVILGNVEKIESGAFHHLDKLQSISIGEGVKEIGDGAFAGTPLRRVDIPNSVTKIGKGLFLDCNNLEYANLGNGIKSVERATFFNCPSLSDIRLGNSVEVVKEGAIVNCAFAHLPIPDSVEHIEAGAIRYCKDFEGVVLSPNSNLQVTDLGNAAVDCENFDDIIFEEEDKAKSAMSLQDMIDAMQPDVQPEIDEGEQDISLDD